MGEIGVVTIVSVLPTLVVDVPDEPDELDEELQAAIPSVRTAAAATLPASFLFIASRLQSARPT
jgi:hypothetical protein